MACVESRVTRVFRSCSPIRLQVCRRPPASFRRRRTADAFNAAIAKATCLLPIASLLSLTSFTILSHVARLPASFYLLSFAIDMPPGPVEGFNHLLDELPVPGMDRQSCRLLGPTALVRLAWQYAQKEKGKQGGAYGHSGTCRSCKPSWACWSSSRWFINDIVRPRHGRGEYGLSRLHVWFLNSA